MSDFIATNLFGAVPAYSSDPDYPNGYGVPNPVPSWATTGSGSMLQCAKTVSNIKDILQEIWAGFERTLTIKGSLTFGAQDNFTSAGTVYFDFADSFTPATPEDPGPVLPRPGADRLRGSQAAAGPVPILDYTSASEGTMIDGLLVGTIDDAIKIAGGPDATNLPVYVRLKRQIVFNFYPWYVDSGSGRDYYCNISLNLSAEAYWDSDYTADPMPNFTVYPWTTVYLPENFSDYRSSKVGELWAASITPGAHTSPINSSLGASKLGDFSLVENVPSTEPYLNVLTFDHVQILTTANYNLRGSI